VTDVGLWLELSDIFTSFKEITNSFTISIKSVTVNSCRRDFNHSLSNFSVNNFVELINMDNVEVSFGRVIVKCVLCITYLL